MIVNTRLHPFIPFHMLYMLTCMHIHTDTHTHKGGGGEGREGERKGEEKGEGWREGRFSKNKNEFSKSLLLKALSFNHMCLRIGSSKG